MKNKEHITIVGAGLTGPLLAIILADKGYEVSLYESRKDIRTANISAGRSINLALSDRGLKALKIIDMDDYLLNEAMPMKGRLIHSQNGETNYQTYSGRIGEHINSVSRAGLNIELLNKAEEKGVNVYFDHRCIDANLDSGQITFRLPNGEIKSVDTTITLGTDGSASAIRAAYYNKSRQLRFSFSQSYLDHGYKELHIPPSSDGNFLLQKDALHIWPRGEYMMIALPNFDGSFTVTMFHPFSGEDGFDAITDEQKLITCFERNYADSIPFLPLLKEDFFQNPTGVLATIKCYPWSANNRFLLVGDSAHAVVPFYGQGMNASFEDCSILSEIIDEYDGDWTKIMPQYESKRKIDADAIGDLAEENFYEMRDHVSDPIFKKKRQLEAILEQQFPNYYSKYSLVTFRDDIPYSVAQSKGNLQDALLMDICKLKSDITNLDLTSIIEKLNNIH